MENAMDPYEQQLLSVFNSYDISHRGSLDREGLLQLCNSLQLEEQGIELIKCLLSDSKSHVTFTEFKDGLLTLLGNVQNNRQKLDIDASSDSESESPDREISPKFVYGSKKYGRRSRPESTEQIELFENLDSDLKRNSEVFVEKYENKPLKNVNKVQRSNSQSDVTHSRKRKTSGKLKRCTSFPGNHEMERQYRNWNQEKKELKSSFGDYNYSTFRTVLEKLGLGSDGHLSHLDIIRVTENMGLHRLTKKLIQQLPQKQDTDKRTPIEDVLEMLQREDFIYEVTTMNNSCITEDTVLFPNSKNLQYITMGPNGTGVVSSQTIIELWENAGIASASSLLLELGFNESMIGIVDLASILEDELRTINESRTDISISNMNPHIVLLQASIALYQSEVKYLKSVLEQLSAERDKLRTDIADANQRASLLAQEIDENHAKMEKSTQNQVKLLEQKHSEIIKELTSQFVGEKEQLSLINSKLEQRILLLESEEAKLQNDLQTIQNYNNALEKENQSLSSKITSLEGIKTSLSNKLSALELECQKYSDIERERDQLEPLLKKLSLLQSENAELRDKNDELCTEVESLNSEVNGMRAKINAPTFNVNYGEENVGICEGVIGLGAIKRRVDSPSKDNECSMETESPRLGKVRRCYQKTQTGEVLQEALGSQVPFNSNESGFEAELDCGDSSLSLTESEGGVSTEVTQLQSRVAYLEQLLIQNSIKFPASSKSVDGNPTETETKQLLINRCKQLISVIREVQGSVSNMISSCTESRHNCELFKSVIQLSDKLSNVAADNSSEENSTSNINSEEIKLARVDSATETDDSYSSVNDSLEKKIKLNNDLLERCENLEQALELLRNEFENCENYWSSKLDEERQIFDQEQKQSSDKLNELLVKISEYEEQFTQTPDLPDGRLSPIEEKDILEQQFTELEEEYDEFRTQMEAALDLKDKEIASLQNLLGIQNSNVAAEACTQTELLDNSKLNESESKISNLTHVVESTNIFSSETLPDVWQYPYNSQPKSNESDESVICNANYIEQNNEITFILKPEDKNVFNSSSLTENSIRENQTNSLPPNMSWNPPIVTSPQPHSINYIPDSQNSCRPKRTRKHDRNIFNSQLRPQRKEEYLKNSDSEGSVTGQPRWTLSMPSAGDHNCVVPISSIHHLHARLRELDQHCRHLQFILKQQQRHSESVMHHCWQQHREEMNEVQMQLKVLQDKLARSDILIKDLYVENTYLMANNQRLEHRCHMLVQCSSESTSV